MTLLTRKDCHAICLQWSSDSSLFCRFGNDSYDRVLSVGRLLRWHNGTRWNVPNGHHQSKLEIPLQDKLTDWLFIRLTCKQVGECSESGA